jgi:catechol 2,3-dioxygenase-like lactoylglutathione lyase family enzyme
MSIEHFAIAAQDTDALARWYGEHLGFSVRFKNDQTPPIYFLAQGDGPVLVEIIPANASKRVDRQSSDPGHSHLAFHVDDFDAAHQRLLSSGIHFTAPPIARPDGTKLAFFHDGEGNLLQIIYRPKPL